MTRRDDAPYVSFKDDPRGQVRHGKVLFADLDRGERFVRVENDPETIRPTGAVDTYPWVSLEELQTDPSDYYLVVGEVKVVFYVGEDRFASYELYGERIWGMVDSRGELISCCYYPLEACPVIKEVAK